MRVFNNMDLRQYMKAKGVRQWELADYYNVIEITVSRWFRREMTKEQKQEIMQVVDFIAAEREGA